MGPPASSQRSRVPWALALAVGIASGLAGYVIHAERVNRIPKQVVTVQRLTDMAGAEESPALSPDGKSVAFVAVSGGRRQIWIQAISGGMPRVLTKDDLDHEAPRWTPDSSSVIYFAFDGIWEISAAGGVARRLVEAEAPGDLSHDGKSLAFIRPHDDADELVVGGRSTGKLDGDMYFNLRWSPDDKKIAFLQVENRQTKVMVISASGGEPVLAAGSDGTIQGFTWAPDNSGLIVSSAEGSPSTYPLIYNLWFIPRVEGRTPVQLTFGELSYESPDINAAGNLVVSRKGLYAEAEADIVMFSGLKW